MAADDLGGCLNIKMSSYQYKDPYVKDKTSLTTVLSLTWESPYLGMTGRSLYWYDALMIQGAMAFK